VLKRLQKAGLKYSMYLSIQEDEVYVLVGYTNNRFFPIFDSFFESA
jgi:hypothetical protein